MALPEFVLHWRISSPGATREIELGRSGELWLTEQDQHGTITHRKLVRKLTTAQLHEVWELVESSGLSQGSGKRFGKGTTGATLTLTVQGRTVTWDFGGELSASEIPAELQRLLQWLEPHAGMEVLRPNLSSGDPSQLGIPQSVR